MKKFIAGAAVAGTATIMALSFAPNAQAADGDSIIVSPPTAPTPGTTVVSGPTTSSPTVSDVSTVSTVDSALPNTGGPSGLLLGGGAALVIAGGAAVVVSRRRQTV
jgi:LPXTG-motif cell wall-anchored protein